MGALTHDTLSIIVWGIYLVYLLKGIIMNALSKISALIILSLIPMHGMQSAPDIQVNTGSPEVAALTSLIKVLASFGVAGLAYYKTDPDKIIKWAQDKRADLLAKDPDVDIDAADLWWLKPASRFNYTLNSLGLGGSKAKSNIDNARSVVSVGAGITGFLGTHLLLYLLLR